MTVMCGKCANKCGAMCGNKALICKQCAAGAANLLHGRVIERACVRTRCAGSTPAMLPRTCIATHAAHAAHAAQLLGAPVCGIPCGNTWRAGMPHARALIHLACAFGKLEGWD